MKQERSMALYLVQHGVSEPKENDPEKGLSPQGREETTRIARVAAGYGVRVNQIFHSGKKRALQTAAIFHQELAVPAPLEAVSGIAPMDDVVSFGAKLNSDSGLMVVGHLPFMARLVGLLTAGDQGKLVYRFQHSGVVCLDAEEQDSGGLNWYICWTLNPHIQ